MKSDGSGEKIDETKGKGLDRFFSGGGLRRLGRRRTGDVFSDHAGDGQQHDASL